MRGVESKDTGSDITDAREVIVKEEEWTDTESEITDAEEIAVEEDE